MATEVRTTPAGEIRFLTDGGKARIDARAILFDSWSVDLGGFRERMMPGSVTLDGDLVALFDHDTSMVLGRTSAGTMEVRQDAAGVAFTAYPPETTWAKDLRVSMERGDIRGCSYRMMVEEDDWYVRDGMVCRDIKKASISELTVTSMPAYPETTAEARSHAQALIKDIPGEDRALTIADEINLSAAAEILDAASELIEKAGETIKDAISRVDLEEPEVDPETDPTTEVDPTDSEDMDGASNEPRSSVGATETPTADAQTFVPGFGFIPNRKES